MVTRPHGRASTLRAAPLAALLLVGSAVPAPAQAIDYAFTGQAYGSLGGTGFSDLFFRAVLRGDAADVGTGRWGAGIPVNEGLRGTITLGDLGTFTLAGSFHVFDWHAERRLGLGSGTHGDLIAIRSDAFAAYDLASELGPVAGPRLHDWQFRDVATSGGLLTLRGSSATFEASLAHATVTPEPATLVLLGSGLAGLGALRRRRRRDTAPD